MKKIKLLFTKKPHNKGQSFMELTIIMLLLISILFSMVEFGNLLNQYITIVDASREGARWGSNADPFAIPKPGEHTFFENIDIIIEGDGTPGQTTALDPIKLDPTNSYDDIVISYFSIVQGGNATRFTPDTSIYHQNSSEITTAQVQNELNQNAPSSGAVLVEIFYRYHQIFNFFRNTNFFDIHAYSIMPLSAAEPTPTPCPPGFTC
jgi:hypothetical protein